MQPLAFACLEAAVQSAASDPFFTIEFYLFGRLC